MPRHRPTRALPSIAALLAATALLAACATRVAPLQKYVAPTAGPTAKVVMRGSLAGNDLYGVFVFDEAESCQGSRLLGWGRTARDAPATTIVANRLTTVDFVMFSGTTSSCRVRWSFTPAAGKTYLVSGGVVISGGGSMMPGLVAAAEKILELPARHGLPQNVTGNVEAISHPSYATAVGLVNFHSFGDWPKTQRAARKSAGSLLGTLRSFVTDLF